MNPLCKGLLLGMANVFAVAAAITSVVGAVDAFAWVLVFGLVPGTIAGGILGFLAGTLPALRRLVLVGLAVLAVVVFGTFVERSLIAPSLPTTIVLALVLERWTRPPERCELSTAWKGALLGCANVFAIASLAGLAQWLETSNVDHRLTALDTTEVIAMLGLAPGVLVGALLGWMLGGSGVATARPLARLALCALPAMTVVMFLGLLGERDELVASAWIPTVVAAAILERWARPVQLPIALARA